MMDKVKAVVFGCVFGALIGKVFAILLYWIPVMWLKYK